MFFYNVSRITSPTRDNVCYPHVFPLFLFSRCIILVMNSEVFFENKKYISAKQAGKVTGYSQDYVGQLCRTGKLDAKRIGRVWYIFEDSILNHKNSPAKIEETSRQVLPKVLDNSFPNSGVTPNDLRESRVGEILDVIKITGQRSQTLINPDFAKTFSKYFLSSD